MLPYVLCPRDEEVIALESVGPAVVGHRLGQGPEFSEEKAQYGGGLAAAAWAVSRDLHDEAVHLGVPSVNVGTRR